MEKRVFFEDARKNVLDMFSIEFPNLPIATVDLFVGMFYKLVNYEEEGTKIRPTILVTSNINAVIKHVPNTKKIIFYEDEDASNFKAHIKALMVFCARGWNIYISFNDDVVEYGIVKALSSIKDKSLMKSLTEKETMETISRRTSLVLINILGGGVVRLLGAKGSNYSICFNLNSVSEYNWENEIYDFVEACISKVKTTAKTL